MDIYDLFCALGDVSDCFVTETEKRSPLIKERAAVKWASVAACACAVLAAALFPVFYRYSHSTTPGASVTGTSAAESEPVKMELLSGPDRTEYVLGEEPDLSGLAFTVTYADGTVSVVSDGFTCPVTVLDALGEYGLTASYRGVECTFTVTVAEPKVEKIAVARLPDKLEYKFYDKIDTAGAVITVTYENGYEREITDGFTHEPRIVTYEAVGAEDSGSVTVEYGGARASYGITVGEREPTDTVLLSGSCGKNVLFSLDVSGTLSVFGTGSMTDFAGEGEVPWGDYAEIISRAVIGDGVTSVGDYAFYGCRNMTADLIPYGVTSIGDYAFYGCGFEVLPELPESVRTVGSHAFEGCGALLSAALPDGLLSLGDCAFRFCVRLSLIRLGTGLETVGESAFASCERLELISIPESVTELGDYAFDGCGMLSYVEVPQNVSSLGEGVFRNCVSLASVSLPRGLYSIGEKTFQGCARLTGVTIPDTVGEIGGWAFSMCDSLDGAVLPESVNYIGAYAFYGCRTSADIYIMNADCEIYDSENTLGHMTLHGYAGSSAELYADEYAYYFLPFEPDIEGGSLQ